jgi:hypothetical protein
MDDVTPPDPTIGGGTVPGPPASLPTPPWGDVAPPMPPMPGVPAPTPTPVPTPSRGSRWRLWVAIGTGVLALVIVLAIVGSRRSGSSDFPDEVLGLPRIRTDQMRAFEDAMGSLKFGDVTMQVAVYGQGSEGSVVVFVYRNLPADAPGMVDGMLRGAAGGIDTSGGTIGSEGSTQENRNGVDYRCLPFTGQLFPDSPSRQGVMCAWSQSDRSAMLLIDSETASVPTGLDHAEAVHDAMP